MALESTLQRDLPVTEDGVRDRQVACSSAVQDFHMERSRGGLTPRDKSLLLGAGTEQVNSELPDAKLRYKLRLRCINTMLDLVLISHRLPGNDFVQVIRDVQQTDYDVSTELISMLYRACNLAGADFEKDLAEGIKAAKRREGEPLDDVSVSIQELTTRTVQTD